ncbi:hypothetical protein AKJ09_07081 [Labilithrix luteola]|uniref:Uncharacterized protein n=1 Tax=Labilithrix luteola TaxID=1391654 RepID=A0A0K1Q3U1_9BACT|nr:hypothetical protein [Labilithrix luteola]AKV00418.1 hypothetical protein AKJ09_07081 [Labilithrix luteola]
MGRSVTAAYLREGDAARPHDLVLLIDHVDPEGQAASAMAPHRTGGRLPTFSAPLEDVLALAPLTLRTFGAPLVRITLVALASGPRTPEDERFLTTYTTPVKGTTFVQAIHVDVEQATLVSNDGASPNRIGLAHAEDPVAWITEGLGARAIAWDGPRSNEPVALFATRAIAIATFFASPLAGAALLGWNFHRTRRTAQGFVVVVTAFALTAFLLTALTPMRSNFGALPITFAGMLGLGHFNRRWFGHPARRASPLLAAALVVLLLSVVGALMAALLVRA